MIILKGNLDDIALTDSEKAFLKKLNPNPKAFITNLKPLNKDTPPAQLKGISAELYHFIATNQGKTDNKDILLEVVIAAEIFNKLHPDCYQDFIKVSYTIKGSDKRYTL